MRTDKIILTNSTALINKYEKAGLKKIQTAIKKLIVSDKKRKIIGQLIFIDDKAEMKKYKSRVVKSAMDEQENKNAVDDLYHFFTPIILCYLVA